MLKCPNCNHKLYSNGRQSQCKNCGYTNDPFYLETKEEDFE